MKQNPECIDRLILHAGIAREDAWTLRRIAMTLHRWHEMECGDAMAALERDETTGKPYFINAMTGRRSSPVADREGGALKRLAKVMKRYPHLAAYVQGDPRGASLYILRPGDVPEGENADSYYNRGIAVYR